MRRARFGSTGGTDGAPLTPIVVPDSGAFGPPRPAADAGQVLIQPGAATPAPAPLRPIRLPSAAELEAQIIAASRRGASAAQLRPLSEKLLRTKAREAALKVPGLPGVQPGAVLKDDAGRPIPIPGHAQTPAPAPRPAPPVVVPGPPVAVPIPIPGVPSADTAATRPAGDVAEKAGSAVGGRITRDLLTFALLTSPAWLAILLFPRRA